MDEPSSSAKFRQKMSPVLYAHRGSSLLAPENTLPAFQLALHYGADIMEIDVRLSRDNVIMVIHDERVDRTCNAQGRVRDMTQKQLATFDAGYHFVDLEGRSHRHRNTRLMSLAELFDYLPDIPINIDIKDDCPQAALAVAELIEKTGRHGAVNVASFHGSVIRYFRTLQPHTTTAAYQAEVARLYFARKLYRNPPFEFVQIPLQYLGIPLATKSFIRHATARGINTVFWTVNDKPTMQYLIDQGATGFVTDRVDIAGPLLGKSSV